MSTSTDRQQFRETVAEVAERAKAILPQAVNGRVESAARLVVNGDVEMLEDGTVKVGGSDPTRWYHLVGPTCTCTDFVQGKAPEGWCKHRIAAGISKRVGEVLAAQPAPAPEAPVAPLPEAPASVNCHLTIEGRQVQLTLRDTDETRLLARLAAVLQQYPAEPGPPASAVPTCPTHGPMQASTKAQGRYYCPKKLYDGSYCKSRWPEK